MVCRKGFPGGASGKETICQNRSCKRHRFDSWFRKIPWRRASLSTPVFLPGESHGQKSLVSCSPQGRKESDMSEATEHTHTRAPPEPFTGPGVSALVVVEWCCRARKPAQREDKRHLSMTIKTPG